MARDRYDVIIVGAGIAGGNCAKSLRESGFRGSIALVGNEPHPPYHRPPLTKRYARGELPVEETYFKQLPFYAGHDIELLLDTEASQLNVQRRTVDLNGQVTAFDYLVLATGAAPRHLTSDSSVSEKVFVVRAIEDSTRVRERMTEGSRWLVVGGGYIGAEFSSSLRVKGADVEYVIRNDVLWKQYYGDRVGGYFQQYLERDGVRITTGDDITSLESAGDGVRATTRNGRTIEADYVLAGIGVKPHLELAHRAGLDTDSGVLCDRFLETAVERIYAVGDIAEYDSVIHGSRLRIEHWDVARRQGIYVGRRIGGATDDPYDVVPYFFSQFGPTDGGITMRYVGPGGGDAYIHGSMEDDAFTAAYVRDGKLSAFLTVNREKDVDTANNWVRELDAARELLRNHAAVDTAALEQGHLLSEQVAARTSG